MPHLRQRNQNFSVEGQWPIPRSISEGEISDHTNSSTPLASQLSKPVFKFFLKNNSYTCVTAASLVLIYLFIYYANNLSRQTHDLKSSTLSKNKLHTKTNKSEQCLVTGMECMLAYNYNIAKNHMILSFVFGITIPRYFFSGHMLYDSRNNTFLPRLKNIICILTHLWIVMSR